MCYSCLSRWNLSHSNKKFFILARIRDKQGRILSQAHNSYVRTDPVFAYYATRRHQPFKEFIHAEMAAFKKIRYNNLRQAHSIFVYRFGEDGLPLLAKPCPICCDIIHFFNIKHVYWTDEDEPLDMTYEEYSYLKDNAKRWIY